MGLKSLSKGWEEVKQEVWGRAAYLAGLFLAPSLQPWASGNLARALVGGGSDAAAQLAAE